ncbi:iron complex outermembrane recepter protein [Gammaproteobacteria bacterium]
MNAPIHSLIVAGCLTVVTVATATPNPDPDLSELSIEELLQVKVTSVAKRSQRVQDSAAAVFVIGHEEIRRSGARAFPDLLRMVPGVEVAQISPGGWAITSRGFNELYSNKLLVLVDGRSIYTPFFSGVYWDEQDFILEDIERIEVIRGPGGTLWGANAVNGVINIITRHSRDTEGDLVVVEAGQPTTGSLAYRHGGKIGEVGSYRIYGKLTGGEPSMVYPGNPDYDGNRATRAGFRADLAPSARDAVMLQGEVYDAHHGQFDITTAPNRIGAQVMSDNVASDGGHFLANWRRDLANGGQWTLQGYADRARRDYPDLGVRINTFDLDFQYRFPLSKQQEITWGAGYRTIDDLLRSSYTLQVSPDRRHSEIFSAFLQDEIALADDLALTLGTKIEHNDDTGMELQPGVRLLWRVSDRSSLWGAVSRAVRTPARSETGLTINYVVIPAVTPTVTPPFFRMTLQPLAITPNPNIDAERLIAYEVGWRGELSRGMSLDLALFSNHYDSLTTTEPDPANPRYASIRSNLMYGETYGVEAALHWHPSERWRLRADYGWLDAAMHLPPGGTNTRNEQGIERGSPSHQFSLHSYYNLAPNWELDTALYHVTSLPALAVSGYTRLDLRLGWRLRHGVEVSLVGQNLTDNRHFEYSSTETVAAEVPRALFGRVELHF